MLASIVLFSRIGKLRNDPRIVKVIHEVVGVPMKYLPLLAACELAGAVGLVLGIWWPLMGCCGGDWYARLLRGWCCVTSACRRCQSHRACCVSLNGIGRSTGTAHPDKQASPIGDDPEEAYDLGPWPSAAIQIGAILFFPSPRFVPSSRSRSPASDSKRRTTLPPCH